MGVKVENASSFSSNNEAEPEEQSISQLMEKVRRSCRTAVFDEVEEVLVSREVKMKREIEKLKGENAVLAEKHQLDQVDKLKLEKQRDFVNQKYERKIRELESQKSKLEDVIDSEFAKWESCLSKLEKDTAQFIQRRSENDEMVVGNGNLFSSSVIHLDSACDLNGRMESRARGSPLNSKGDGDLQTSGGLKTPSIVIIDSDDDCAPGDTFWQRKTSEKPKEDNYLGSTSGEKNPRVQKRKRASSLSSDENDRDNFEHKITPTGVMKQSMKASLDLKNSQTVSQAEEKVAGEKFQDFCMSHAKVNDGYASTDDSTSSSSCEDDDRLQSSYSAAMKTLNERKVRKDRQGAVDSSL